MLALGRGQVVVCFVGVTVACCVGLHTVHEPLSADARFALGCMAIECRLPALLSSRPYQIPPFATVHAGVHGHRAPSWQLLCFTPASVSQTMFYFFHSCSSAGVHGHRARADSVAAGRRLQRPGQCAAVGGGFSRGRGQHRLHCRALGRTLERLRRNHTQLCAGLRALRWTHCCCGLASAPACLHLQPGRLSSRALCARPMQAQGHAAAPAPPDRGLQQRADGSVHRPGGGHGQGTGAGPRPLQR